MEYKETFLSKVETVHMKLSSGLKALSIVYNNSDDPLNMDGIEALYAVIEYLNSVEAELYARIEEETSNGGKRIEIVQNRKE